MLVLNESSTELIEMKKNIKNEHVRRVAFKLLVQLVLRAHTIAVSTAGAVIAALSIAFHALVHVIVTQHQFRGVRDVLQ